jgi:hypothetical protein
MKVIADQEIRVATLSGAVVLFEPGVEREVSDEIGLLALQQGAKQVDAAPVAPAPKAVVINDVPEVEALEPVVTIDDVITGVEKLVELGDPDDFKADGTPKASALNRVVGRNVSPEEREAAWEAFIKS